MILTVRRLCACGVWAIASLPLSAACYVLVLPYYERVLTFLANVLLKSVSPRLTVAVNHDAQLVVSTTSALGVGVLDRYDPHVVFLNLVILPALVLASPVGLARRIKVIAATMPVLLFVDVMMFFGMVQTRTLLAGDPYNGIYAWMWGTVMAGGQVTAVLAWALAHRDVFGRATPR